MSVNIYRNGQLIKVAGSSDPDTDSAKNTVTFDSDDMINPDKYTEVDLIASGDTHASIFTKISSMIKNIRWIKKYLTARDEIVSFSLEPSEGLSFNNDYTYGTKIGNLVEIQFYEDSGTEIGNSTIITNVPSEYIPSKQVWFPIYSLNGANFVGRGVLSTNGTIFLVATGENKISRAQGRVVYILE